jgi:hypothetical protein
MPAGKELIENLTVLRFSNRVFEPLWSRQYIRNVQVGLQGVDWFGCCQVAWCNPAVQDCHNRAHCCLLPRELWHVYVHVNQAN